MHISLGDVMILKNSIQIQICGLNFKSKSIFFYEINLDFYKIQNSIQIQICGLDYFFMKLIWNFTKFKSKY